eukprot:COSAG02_NODE_2080_length_9901_cov_103.580086_7_plen_221_part_00
MVAMDICERPVTECCDCNEMDKEHGVKPAELIRTVAKELGTTLKAHATQQHVAQSATANGAADGSEPARMASGDGQGVAAEIISRQLLQSLQATTDDSEDAPSLQAINTIAAPFTKGKEEDFRLPEAQLRAISLWLAQRLGGETTAPKLKSLLVLEKLLNVSHDDNIPLLASGCKAAAVACLEWSAVDPRHGDRPAALVREKARAVVSLFDSTHQGGTTG